MPLRMTIQREKDLEEIARRYLRGEWQATIAADLNVSQQTVSNDLRLLQSRWQKAALMDFDAAKAREIAKIDHLELTYWQAWQRSLLPVETTTTKRVTGDSSHDEASLRKQAQEGNPAFLKGVEWCIDKRCRLVGFDAPVKVAPVSPDGIREYSGLSDAELSKRILALLEEGLVKTGAGIIE